MKIINNTGITLNLNNTLIQDALRCRDARIYTENGVPYIDWHGTSKTNDGYVLEVHIPKMSLDLSRIERDEEMSFMNGVGIKCIPSRQIFVTNEYENDEMIITIKEREVTKKQLEKELGYKLKIVEDK